MLWTDSESSIEKVLLTDGEFPKSNTEAICEDYAAIAKIHRICKLFPGILLKWLESHQKLSRVEQELNDIPDWAASMQHQAKGSWRDCSLQEILPVERTQLILDEDLCETN